MSKLYTALAGVIFGGILGFITPLPPGSQRPQQLVYESQTTLSNGQRAGILMPNSPIALGVQSRSGSRVMVVGDILRCEPFVNTIEVMRKNDAGELEPATSFEQLLNCGPPAPGEPDRILSIVGIQWR